MTEVPGGPAVTSGLTPECVAAATLSALREPLDELRQRLATLEAAVVASLGAPESPPCVSPSGAIDRAPDALRGVWDAAPLSQRIVFVRGLLPTDHPQRSVLGEVSGLVDLCGVPAELESWLARYPTLFAEAASGAVLPAASLGPDDDLSCVGAELLREVRERVGAVLAGLGVSWIVPLAGEAPTADCEVVGEEPASQIVTGRIKRVRRPGFRRLGRLELPAQVILAGSALDAAAEHVVAPAEARQRVAPSSSTTGGSSGPEWLQVLRGQAGAAAPEAMRCLDALGRVAQAGRSAPDAAVTEAFGPLLTWLGTGWGSAGVLPQAWLDALAPYRTQLLAWLAAELDAELVVAAERDGFEPDAMEGVGERRTAHPHERGTVARLQSPGLRRDGRVLLRARVIRYESGGQR